MTSLWSIITGAHVDDISRKRAQARNTRRALYAHAYGDGSSELSLQQTLDAVDASLLCSKRVRAATEQVQTRLARERRACEPEFARTQRIYELHTQRNYLSSRYVPTLARAASVVLFTLNAASMYLSFQ